MERGFSTQVILAKAQAIEEGGYLPNVGIVIDLLQTNESVQASMIPVAVQNQPGLYLYRFQVPVGDVYRFRLSVCQPLFRPEGSVLSNRLIDFAISRAATEDGGICANHFQPLRHGNELHLGEADYLSLLAHGQCACAGTTTIINPTSDDLKDDGCYKCPFGESRGVREVGDAPENIGLQGGPVALDRLGKIIMCEDLEWTRCFEQNFRASEEVSQTTLDEPEASFPEPDEPATGLDERFPVDGYAGEVGRRAVDVKEGELREGEKWSGVCGESWEDGDCLQRRQQRTSLLLKLSDKEGDEEEEEEEEEVDGELLLTQRSLKTAHDVWADDGIEFSTAFRFGSSDVGTRSSLAPVGEEALAHSVLPPFVLTSDGEEHIDNTAHPLSHRGPTTGDEHLDQAVHLPALLSRVEEEPLVDAVHPHSVLAPVGEEALVHAVQPSSTLAQVGEDPVARAADPNSVLECAGDDLWSSAVEAKVGARQTFVLERCRRNCVHASDKENILYASFDDHNTFLLPQITDRLRQTLCSATLPLSPDVVRDILQVISDSKFHRLIEESDSEPRHPIEGSDFEPLLLSTFEKIDPALSADCENALQPHESKAKKLSSRTGTRLTLTSEDDDGALTETSSSSATRATAVEADADAIIELSEDVETSCAVAGYSHRVDYEVRLRFWSRARRAVVRVFQRIRDFLRGLVRDRRRASHQVTRTRRSRLSRPSWTNDAERGKCDDLSKV